nr:MAG TPA: hypothetical protein [Bacteriophage sp.]
MIFLFNITILIFSVIYKTSFLFDLNLIIHCKL